MYWITCIKNQEGDRFCTARMVITRSKQTSCTRLGTGEMRYINVKKFAVKPTLFQIAQNLQKERSGKIKYLKYFLNRHFGGECEAEKDLSLPKSVTSWCLEVEPSRISQFTAVLFCFN